MVNSTLSRRSRRVDVRDSLFERISSEVYCSVTSSTFSVVGAAVSSVSSGVTNKRMEPSFSAVRFPSRVVIAIIRPGAGL
eukprot:CAMPEP_0171301096 /NCGR_PEP_ID=MMETSP0816-20121228/10163_1 /TAXON_ID=420281 /ORGANISM="Proboscia inermis, Strain CCAP1064/1" /LENGTH=79 /DNA_ID=CAMNT_0011778311 /DNA_START=47 /DNA_END=283 /DNA_ORIENTATION=-